MLLGAEIEAIYFCVKISLWLIAAWVEKKNQKLIYSRVAGLQAV